MISFYLKRRIFFCGGGGGGGGVGLNGFSRLFALDF